MQIVPFHINDQEKTAKFMDTIWDEMGPIDDAWKEKPIGGFTNLKTFFHIPNEGVVGQFEE